MPKLTGQGIHWKIRVKISVTVLLARSLFTLAVFDLCIRKRKMNRKKMPRKRKNTMNGKRLAFGSCSKYERKTLQIDRQSCFVKRRIYRLVFCFVARVTIQLSNTKVCKCIIRSRVSSFSLSIFVCWLNFVCSLISRCDSCQFLRVNFNFQDVNSAVQKDRCTLVAVSCYGIRGFCWPKLWLSTFAHTQIPPRTPLKRNIFSTQFSQGEQTIRFCSIL